MKQYQELLQQIISKGTWKKPARVNLPKTKSLFGTRMEFDMKDGFPLLTTKKMYYKSIIVELLWFIKGDTNIKYLVDRGCNIWNKDAYRWFLKKYNERGGIIPLTMKEFIDAIKNPNCDGKAELTYWTEDSGNRYTLGDLGKVYGDQWRNQNGVDQLKTVIERLIEKPEGRYAILDAWNPSDFSEMALPPCHLLYQFNCRELTLEDRVNIFIDSPNCPDNYYFIDEDHELEVCNNSNVPKYYLDLQLYQRSCDTFLGVPFNIASEALLLELIARLMNMIPSKVIWVGGDTHLYSTHIAEDKTELQLSREPFSLPKLQINKEIKSLEDLEKLNPEDIEIIGYQSHPRIKADLSVGL